MRLIRIAMLKMVPRAWFRPMVTLIQSQESYWRDDSGVVGIKVVGSQEVAPRPC